MQGGKISAAGAVAPLVELLKVTSTGVPLNAANALHGLAAAHITYSKEVASHGALPPLVQLAGNHPAPAVNVAAIRCLGVMAATGEANRKQAR